MLILKKILLFFILFVFLIHPAANASSLRIVSLYPAATNEIFLLKGEANLVGCSRYGVVPKGYSVERVGSVTNADIERILRLKANLIIVGNLMNINDIKKLKKLKIKVLVFQQPKNFFDVCRQMLKLGKILNKEDLSNSIAKKSQKSVMFIKNITQNLKKPRVFVQIGSHPLFAAGRDYFINDFIKFAGGINIVKKSGIYSVEEIIRKNPDVIIISQMGFNGIKQKRKWEHFKFLKAVKTKKILILDDYSLCSPTPITFTETLKKIAQFLHPELCFDNKK